MRRILVVLPGVLVMAWVALSSVRPAAAADQAKRNKAVARRVFDEILGQGRYELFDQIYTKDFVKHVDLRDHTLAEEIEDAKGTRGASSDMAITIDDMIAEGDRVAIRYTGRGTNDGPLSGMPPSGRKMAITGMTIYRLVDGRIAEEWTTYNMLEIMRQLGYYPPKQP
jgi:steroid delta-isomerase-like uncharacterized protein